MLPSPPPLPSWPSITWSYEGGFYCLTEEDADKVLSYLENDIPLYKYQIDQYHRKIGIILETLSK